MSTVISTRVQPLKSYSTHYGFDPTNSVDQGKVLTLDQARKLYDDGLNATLLFGDPTNPNYCIHIYKGDFESRRRIDIEFYENLESQRVYFVEYGPEEFDDPRNEMLLVQYRSDLYDAEGNRGTLFVADVFVDGDLPTLQFNRKIWHAVSVPWQDFYLGPPPSFDELLDGSFVARLPKITMPPQELLVEHIHQRDRSAKTPKRTPIGHFPW